MSSAFKFLTDSRQREPSPPRVTSHYVELEIPLSPETALVLYYLPKSEHAIWVATCWEENFARFFRRGDSQDDLQQRLREFPTLGVLLWCGLRGHYRRGALIQAHDRDNASPKWMLVCEVTGVNLENADELFGPATREASQVVIARSVALWRELQRYRRDGFSFSTPENSRPEDAARPGLEIL